MALFDSMSPPKNSNITDLIYQMLLGEINKNHNNSSIIPINMGGSSGIGGGGGGGGKSGGGLNGALQTAGLLNKLGLFKPISKTPTAGPDTPTADSSLLNYNPIPAASDSGGGDIFNFLGAGGGPDSVFGGTGGLDAGLGTSGSGLFAGLFGGGEAAAGAAGGAEAGSAIAEILPYLAILAA